MDKCPIDVLVEFDADSLERAMELVPFAVVGMTVLSMSSESESEPLESELESLPLSLELSERTPTADSSCYVQIGRTVC